MKYRGPDLILVSRTGLSLIDPGQGARNGVLPWDPRWLSAAQTLGIENFSVPTTAEASS